MFTSQKANQMAWTEKRLFSCFECMFFFLLFVNRQLRQVAQPAPVYHKDVDDDWYKTSLCPSLSENAMLDLTHGYQKENSS